MDAFGKIQACASGATSPSNDGPSSTPATISLTTCACAKRAPTSPTSRHVARMTASWKKSFRTSSADDIPARIPRWPARARGLFSGRVRDRRRRRQRQPDGERRAVAGLARHDDRAAELLREAPHDVEPQTGTAEAARLGAVGLAELLEDRVLVLRLDADAGVAHLDVERAALGGGLDAYVALLGELERVADEVPDDDGELSRIGAQAHAAR